MNATNRAIVILLILLLTLAGIAIAVVPMNIAAYCRDYAKGVYEWLSYHDQTHRALYITLRILAGVVILALGLMLLWLELRRPRKKVVRVQKLEGGESFIAMDAIEQRLTYSIDQLPDVVKVAPRVAGYGRGGLDLELEVETAPEIDVRMKTEEVIQVAKEVVSERMGLKLGNVQVKIKHAPYPSE